MHSMEHVKFVGRIYFLKLQKRCLFEAFNKPVVAFEIP